MGRTVQCSRFPISCWQSMAELGIIPRLSSRGCVRRLRLLAYSSHGTRSLHFVRVVKSRLAPRSLATAPSRRSVQLSLRLEWNVVNEGGRLDEMRRTNTLSKSDVFRLCEMFTCSDFIPFCPNVVHLGRYCPNPFHLSSSDCFGRKNGRKWRIIPLHDPLKGSLHLTFCPLFSTVADLASYMNSFPSIFLASSAFSRVFYSAYLIYKCTFLLLHY